ncbi:MAG: alpha/beta hydrolase [Sphingomonas fennica]
MIPTEMDERAGAPVVLTVPGLGNSGPDHWQTLWEQARQDTERVDLGLWDDPRRDQWVARLDAAIGAAHPPVILVAHSLGCHAVAWWAALHAPPYGWPVAAAILVAPPDLDRADRPAEIADFAPAAACPLPFPALVVASGDDPYCALDRARGLASGWGAGFLAVGDHGHLNAASGLGRWPRGQALLDAVIDAVGGVAADAPPVRIDWPALAAASAPVAA